MRRTNPGANLSVSTSHGALVSIDFYSAEQLPLPLRAEAVRQHVSLGTGLIAVRTLVASPPKYLFDDVGTTPEEIKLYYEKLAMEDGQSLDDVAKKALSAD